MKLLVITLHLLSTFQILSCNTLFLLYKRQQMRVPALEDSIILHWSLIRSLYSPMHFSFTNEFHLCSHITYHCKILYTLLNFFKILVYCFCGWKLQSANTNIPCCQPFLTIFKSLPISFSYKHTLGKSPQLHSGRKHTNGVFLCWRKIYN